MNIVFTFACRFFYYNYKKSLICWSVSLIIVSLFLTIQSITVLNGGIFLLEKKVFKYSFITLEDLPFAHIYLNKKTRLYYYHLKYYSSKAYILLL